MDTQRKTALVLGATGGLGGEMARQLAQAGWQVRALVRGRARVAGRDGLDWREGDAMNAADVLRAAQGVQVIVHAVNPPGYQRWHELVLPMLDNTIAAARASGARIVLPGNVYNFGPDAFAQLTVESPQNPLTRKGAVRVEMERRLQAAAAQGVRSLVLRAGDFFGPGAQSNWFAQMVVKAGQPVRRVVHPGRVGVGHQWAYLPDVARTLVQLIAMEPSLPAFARYHFAGHWDATGREMAEAVQRVVRAATGASPRIAGFSWWLLRIVAPVVPLFREIQEMRYLWQVPVRMRNDELRAVLGEEPHTPLDQAVHEALVGLGCLPSPTPAWRAQST